MIKQNPSSYESHNSIVISDIKEKEGGGYDQLSDQKYTDS